jgi:hypothetical protein
MLANRYLTTTTYTFQYELFGFILLLVLLDLYVAYIVLLSNQNSWNVTFRIRLIYNMLLFYLPSVFTNIKRRMNLVETSWNQINPEKSKSEPCNRMSRSWWPIVGIELPKQYRIKSDKVTFEIFDVGTFDSQCIRVLAQFCYKRKKRDG